MFCLCFFLSFSSSIILSISLVNEEAEGRSRAQRKERMIKQKNKWKVDLIFEQWTKIWSTSLKSCLGFFKKKNHWDFFVTIIWNISFFSFFTCILSLFSILFTWAGNFPFPYETIGHAKPLFYCSITANPLVTCWWSATFRLSDLSNLSNLWKWLVLKGLLRNPLLPVTTHPWPSVVFRYQIWPKMVDNWSILPPACHVWTGLRYRSYPLFLISKQLFWSVLSHHIENYKFELSFTSEIPAVSTQL